MLYRYTALSLVALEAFRIALRGAEWVDLGLFAVCIANLAYTANMEVKNKGQEKTGDEGIDGVRKSVLSLRDEMNSVKVALGIRGDE